MGMQRYKAVSWDEALNYIANKMRRIVANHGRESMALIKHGKAGKPWVKLWHALGSKTEGHPSFSQCRGPRDIGWVLTYGDTVGSPERLALDKMKSIAFIGGHLGENMHNITVQDYTRGLHNGAQNIVVDPRYSTAASKAKYWLPIKPGTDTALLLAWTQVLIYEELYDKDFVANYTTGFDELKSHVKDMTPEWASPYTGLPADLIRKSARLLGQNAPHSMVFPGRHFSWYGDDTQRARAMAILNAILGNWGRDDGIFLGDRINVPKFSKEHKSHIKGKKAFEQMERYPYALDIPAQDLLAACIPGRYDPKKKEALVKGMIVVGSNLPYTIPNGDMVKEAAENLDLFVVVDNMPAEVTGYADVVLPDTTYLERYDVLSNSRWREPFVAIRQPVVKPMYNSKPSWWIAKELARRLGLGDAFPYDDFAEVIEDQLKQMGSSIKDINQKGGVLTRPPQKDKTLKFNTPSQKVELYSQRLKDQGMEPIPKFVLAKEPPVGFYRLIFGRTPQHTFTRTTNNPELFDLYDENSVWVNKKICELHGIRDGQYVVLASSAGARSKPIRVRATERVREDVVYMVHGFGRNDRRLRRSYGKGASDNALIQDYEVDPIMGGTGHQVNFVTFVK
jgi:thiosulfate reductase/polysulfide reductase chain A